MIGLPARREAIAAIIRVPSVACSSSRATANTTRSSSSNGRRWPRGGRRGRR
ncbi:hypothetical protein DVA67_031515 [Solirubrobacter sp. CPCC 204708]|nr:hypothetical protein [Solirubrobacter deserti]